MSFNTSSTGGHGGHGRGNGRDDPADHDLGDDRGSDDPATHDVGDDRGLHDPAAHDVGDDHGGERSLGLFVNQATQQLVFSADPTELEHWRGDDRLSALDLTVPVPTADRAGSVPVWRFHDPASDVYFWTADDRVRDTLLRDHPQLAFDGEAFRAWRDDGGGTRQAIGVVWDHGRGGDYGQFVYAPVDDAVRLAGRSDADGLEYLGVAFWV